MDRNIPDDLDRFDRAILSVLGREGRITLQALAERIGLSKSPCQARLKRLERDGFILGYRAVVDTARLRQSHIAFVEVKLSDTREAALQAFNTAARAVPEIEECHMMASNYDFLLKIRTTNIAAYRRVLGETISTLPHVTQTSTHVAMETVKEAGDQVKRVQRKA